MFNELSLYRIDIRDFCGSVKIFGSIKAQGTKKFEKSLRPAVVPRKNSVAGPDGRREKKRISRETGSPERAPGGRTCYFIHDATQTLFARRARVSHVSRDPRAKVNAIRLRKNKHKSHPQVRGPIGDIFRPEMYKTEWPTIIFFYIIIFFINYFISRMA